MAEAEYISSKAALFQCSEQKELLSEHLCAVIQQNETRKAAKLSELLKTLNIENGGEESVASISTEQPTTPVFLRTPTPGIQHWHTKNTDGRKGGSDHVSDDNASRVLDASHVTNHVTQTYSTCTDSKETNLTSTSESGGSTSMDSKTEDN